MKADGKLLELVNTCSPNDGTLEPTTTHELCPWATSVMWYPRFRISRIFEGSDAAEDQSYL